jgi:hypothetical protein
VIGNFNFTPVRKTFDAEEVELLEKRLKMSLCFRSFEKKFKIKSGRSCFQSEKRYHTLTEVSSWEYFAWMLVVIPLMSQLVSDFRTVISRSFREWLANAVHDDDRSNY